MSFDWHNELFVRLSWIRFINLFQMSSKCHFACSVTVVSGFQKLYKNKKLFCYFQTMTFFFSNDMHPRWNIECQPIHRKKWKKWSKWPFFPDCTVWHFNKQSRKINGLCSVCNEAVTSRPTLANLIHMFLLLLFFVALQLFLFLLLSIHFRCPCVSFECSIFAVFPLPLQVE